MPEPLQPSSIGTRCPVVASSQGGSGVVGGVFPLAQILSKSFPVVKIFFSNMDFFIFSAIDNMEKTLDAL